MSSRLLSPILFAASLIPLTSAMPLTKRASTGAKAGMGIGIAVVVILVILITTFLIIHFRRSRHIAAINKERAILAGEKNKDGSDKIDKFDPKNQPTATITNGEKPAAGGMPRRNKSVKDRLMGPLYRGSTIDMVPLPQRAKLANAGENGGRDSAQGHWDNVDGQPFLHKPWADGESSPRPSFSSKRATRMMMMM